MNRHQRNIEVDCQILLRHTRDYAAAMSRGTYFPLDDADFGASGCLDAPEWIPAGYCGMWFHNAGHVGMIVLNREEPV